ncbi:MAG: DUF2970 domain-containing protein [Methylicorpusculum sp.]|uniref:DUF2970 domain-containing protein n=1 Tax=Methylicorpusculum sp. TaxID=2713644 RepID=UPI0027176454|nr:DUF2970 domain-containing protein [Methylicorpusculum sp.]MDO8845202.1 DUF2970 domain-containing protein [Methylicorpusculum sp.]MDO8939670.1 DUF2970 domain-containing protein [Methylicorpusculum sp.]MDO9241500.1 DUF2970 domain-containing protein [Methylicorpusculum sp.]MDP2179735.1 DUF2970 domain-containing protein [Methylicorpusculum sp.]MDP2201947.1 DUF2970 domain-containing protein [Methylicorpusculum sp.]
MSKTNILTVIKSVLAAAIGVQSDQNRKKDFEEGSLSSYIIAGLIFTVLFILALSFLVSRIIGS